MKLIKFTHTQKYGCERYVQFLFNQRRAFFQAEATWCFSPGWPYFSMKIGNGRLISLQFDIYKLGVGIDLFERTWDIEE